MCRGKKTKCRSDIIGHKYSCCHRVSTCHTTTNHKTLLYLSTQHMSRAQEKRVEQFSCGFFFPTVKFTNLLDGKQGGREKDQFYNEVMRGQVSLRIEWSSPAVLLHRSKNSIPGWVVVLNFICKIKPTFLMCSFSSSAC